MQEWQQLVDMHGMMPFHVFGLWLTMMASRTKGAVLARFGTAETIDYGLMAYYTAFSLYVLSYSLVLTTFDSILLIPASSIYQVMRIVCALFLVAKMIGQRFSSGQLMAFSIIGAILVLSLFVTGDWNLLVLFLFVVAGKDVSVKKLAMIALSIQFTVLLAAAIAANVGLIEASYSRRYVEGVLQERSSMGFTNPNVFGKMVLSICCSYGVIRFPRFKIWDYCAILVVAILCYYYSGSRTASMGILFLAVVAVVARLCRSKKRQRGILIASMVIIVACAAFSFYIMAAYSPSVEWMNGLNELLSGRPSMMNGYFLKYPPEVFGYEAGSMFVVTGATISSSFDNAYCFLLIQTGWLPSVIFLGVYFSVFVHCLKRCCFNSCTFGLLIYAVVSTMESVCFVFAFNYCLIGVSYMLYGMPDSELGGDAFKSGSKQI